MPSLADTLPNMRVDDVRLWSLVNFAWSILSNTDRALLLRRVGFITDDPAWRRRGYESLLGYAVPFGERGRYLVWLNRNALQREHDGDVLEVFLHEWAHAWLEHPDASLRRTEAQEAEMEIQAGELVKYWLERARSRP